MKSPLPKARTLLSATKLMLLVGALSACVQAPPVYQTANPCSELVPDDWTTTGIASAALPAGKTAGDWIGFGVAQTGQLDKANNNTKDAVKIIAKCEARDKAVIDSLQPKPWWQIF